MGRISIHNASLEYSDQGSGDPLVLVHGSASDHRSWHYQVDTLSEHFRTINYSRRYHWPNDPIPAGTDYAMAEQLEDLKALLQTLDAAPAHLVGHSYGAFLCLLLAIEEPELVRSMVLAEPPVVTLFVSNSPKPKELLKLLFTRPWTAVAVIKFGLKGLAPAQKAFRRDDSEKGVQIFGDAVFGQGAYEQLSGLRKKQVQDNISNIKAELLGSGFLPLDTEEISRIQVPTLLINGEQSIALFHRLVDRLEELIPDVRRKIIPEGSHAMHMDSPAIFNRTILSFIRSV